MLAARPVSGLFSLSEEILACATITSKGHSTDGLLLQTAKEIDRKLNSTEDRLLDDPAHLCRDGLYFDIKQLLAGFNELGTEAKLKLVGIIQTAFGKLCQGLRNALSKAPFNADNWKLAAEMYAATTWNVIMTAENVDKAASSTGKGTSAKGKQSIFDWGQIRTALLESIKLFTALPLGRVFDSPAERESVASCFVKAAHRILEAPENAKSPVTKRLALEILVECARAQGYTMGLQTIISQDLIYFEHLAEPIAELLQLLYAANDSGCELVCDEILKTLGVHRFSPQDSTTSTRIAATFLVKFAATCPREALKSLSLFIDQIDSEAYSIRMAMVEVIGSLIFHLMSQEDRSDNIKAQTKSLFGALEERFRDVNSFVRSKTIQVCCDLAK
jgi:condensin complex subunit 1